MPVAHLFIRDDDVSALSDPFLFLMQTALETGIPVVYGVIPERADKPLIRCLKALKQETPGALDIVQHGWTHEDHSLKGEKKYEFGPLRAAQQQLTDIQSGLTLMRRVFGKTFTPAFVPPYHGFDAATLKSVRESGFKAFSAGRVRADVPQGCLDLPAMVSLNTYAADGTPQPVSAAVMLSCVRQALRPGALTGAVLHHEVFAGARERVALKRFFQGIRRWQEEGELKVVLFSDILRARGRQEQFLKKKGF